MTVGLPPYADPVTCNVSYQITDSADGIPVIGISLSDLLAAQS